MMKRTEHVKEIVFGSPINFITYETKDPSDYWLEFLHGAGERGPLDGSGLSLVDKLGYPKFAKAGFDFPFNIIAPQCVTSYAQIKHIMPAYIKLKYNAKAIIVTGLSLGGYGTFDTKQNDKFNLVHAIAPVCGGGTPVDKVPFTELVKEWKETNGWAFHGDVDSTVPYKQSKSIVDAYNASHTNVFKYTLYPGVGHDAWIKAYSVTPGQDELLQWIKVMFESAPKESAGFNVALFKAGLESLIQSSID